MTRMISPPTENCGSSSDPEIGSSMSITPARSLSSETASSTGSLVAVGLSTRCAERELVEHQRFSADELAVLDLVVHVERELALLDPVAGVLHRVGRERRQVDVARLAGEVERQLARERMDSSRDLDRRGAIDARVHRDVAGLFGGKRRHAAGDIGQVGRIVRPARRGRRSSRCRARLRSGRSTRGRRLRRRGGIAGGDAAMAPGAGSGARARSDEPREVERARPGRR